MQDRGEYKGVCVCVCVCVCLGELEPPRNNVNLISYISCTLTKPSFIHEMYPLASGSASDPNGSIQGERSRIRVRVRLSFLHVKRSMNTCINDCF